MFYIVSFRIRENLVESVQKKLLFKNKNNITKNVQKNSIFTNSQKKSDFHRQNY